VHARVEVPVHHTRTELVAAHLWSLGAVGVWHQPGRLVAWFTALPDPLRPAGAAHPTLPTELTSEQVTVVDEPDRDWQDEWKATIAPVHAGRITVVPSWLADDHLPADGELTLVLDPGRAFGSGHHATTALCLELLDELDLDGSRVADVGCGTGVLAIAAAARGARVTAVDIDPEAVEVTRENAARNRVEVAATTGSVGALDTPADVVVANLVTDVVRALAAELVALTAGTLVVSGITSERRTDALGALEAVGARVDEVRERDGWIAARLSVPAVIPADDEERT
jgi:ribosomal protein L11 methyltransferase